MENQNNTEKNSEKFADCCGNKHSWHSRKHKGFWLVVLIFLIIGSIFCFSFGFGSRHISKSFKASYYPMMGIGRGGMMSWNINGNFPAEGMMRGWQEFNQKNAVQIFGVISKIEGAKITVVDNGNEEKIINSVSDTRIISITGQASLSVLKAGQNISALGEMRDNQLQASFIRIY